MKKIKVDLPKVYENELGNYPQYKGRQKLSYSQYSSFSDPQYRGTYISNYFMGIPDPGNIFSDYGSFCGQYIEGREVPELSEEDKKVLDKIGRPENARYEVEVVIDLLPITGVDLIIQGFIDREIKLEDGIEIIDVKTGNHKDKVDYYGGEDYQQTTLYSHAREKEGEKIAYSGVILFERKGNGMEKYPLKLSGNIKHIPTPYSEERALKILKKISDVAIEISDYYGLYKKLFVK